MAETTLTIDVTKEVNEAAQEVLRDHLVIGSLEVPMVVVIGEDHVSTDPQNIHIVLEGKRLEAINRLRRALVTNRERFLNDDHNFGTNQDAVIWLIDQITSKEKDEGATDDNTTT